MRFWCNSCVKCHQRKGWQGLATYQNQTVRVHATDVATLALIRSHLENKESYRMQQLLQFLRKELPKCVPLPDEKNIRYFIENERKR